MISTMLSLSIRAAVVFPKKKIMLYSCVAPSSRGELNVYWAPLFKRSEKGRNGSRSATSLISATFMAATVCTRGIRANRKSSDVAVPRQRRRRHPRRAGTPRPFDPFGFAQGTRSARAPAAPTRTIPPASCASASSTRPPPGCRCSSQRSPATLRLRSGHPDLSPRIHRRPHHQPVAPPHRPHPRRRGHPERSGCPERSRMGRRGKPRPNRRSRRRTPPPALLPLGGWGALSDS